MKYSLEIIQSVCGEESAVAVDAEGAFDGGVLILEYTFDCAKYVLEISEREMKQTRTGDIGLKMRFVMGETTRCVLSDGEQDGVFYVFTEEYQADFMDGKCTVNCLFSDGDSGDCTRIVVRAVCIE